MPRKPHPTQQARQHAVDWLRDDTSVSDEEKIAWLHTLTGAEGRKRKSVDADQMTPDWLSSKFEAEADRRYQQQVRAGAVRYALLLLLAVTVIVGVAALTLQIIENL